MILTFDISFSVLEEGAAARKLMSKLLDFDFISSNVGSDFSSFGDLVAAAFLHTEHLMPLTAALAISLPPDNLTILSNSAFGGCPELKCNLRMLESSALGHFLCSSGGKSNSIPPSGISPSSSTIA